MSQQVPTGPRVCGFPLTKPVGRQVQTGHATSMGQGRTARAQGLGFRPHTLSFVPAVFPAVRVTTSTLQPSSMLPPASRDLP